MNYEINIGKILKNEREKLELSVRELARRTGLSASTIFDIEKNNSKKYEFNTIVKIAKELNLDLNKLVNNEYKNDEMFECEPSIILRRTDENKIEIESNNMESVLEYIKFFEYNVEEILPNIGDEIEIAICDSIDSDSCDDYLYCPNCSKYFN